MNHEIITVALAEWVASCSLLSSVVESTYFVKLTNLLDGEYVVPFRRSLQRIILADLESAGVKMKSAIHAEANSFCLTTDAWSTKSYKGYIAVTLHYITSNWKLRSTLLYFKRFETLHTGDALATLLESIISG